MHAKRGWYPASRAGRETVEVRPRRYGFDVLGSRARSWVKGL